MTEESVLSQELVIPATDVLVPFQLEGSGLRGRFVRMAGTLDTILGQHAYPTAVARLLGQATTLAAVLASALKYEGVFTLQTKGDGPVTLLVADVTSAGHVRACAHYNAEPLAQAGEGPLLGKGYLAFTVDQQAVTDRYQGIVPLESDDLAVAVQTYFRQSEQIPTAVVLGIRQDDAGHWQAGCLMLQQMPREGGNTDHQLDTAVEDDWHRAMLLMQTATEVELVDPALPPETLLFRLFHEEGIRVYATHGYEHRCRCSAARVESMLRSLPFDEIKALAVQDAVEVTCEFCNKTYRVPLSQLSEPKADNV